jgi:phosphohistidine phosphatase
MLQLTLVRHAKAAPEPRPGVDFPRQLDGRGRREAAEMAERAQALGLRPDCLYASPAARTLETAEAFARALDIPRDRQFYDDRLYLADRDALLEVLRETAETCAHALLVGHNPGLSRLATGLADGEADDELPTGAMVGFRLACRHWARIDWHCGERVLLEIPRQIEER